MSHLNVQTVNDVTRNTSENNVVSEKEKYLVAMKNHSLMGQGMCTMGDMMLLFTELANAKFQQMSNKMAVSRDAQNMANKVEIAIAKIAKDGDTAELPADVLQYMRDNNILVDGNTIDEMLDGKLEELIASGDVDTRQLDYLSVLIALSKDGVVNIPLAEKVKQLEDIMNDLVAKGIKIDGKSPWSFLIQDGKYQGSGKGIDIPVESFEKLKDVVKGELKKELAGSVQFKKTELLSVQKALEHTSGTASDFVQQSQLKLQQLMQNFNTAVTMANSIQSMNGESTKSIAQSIR
ncbi:secretion protein EspA [Rahnella sp. SAP-1]|uniref:Secretion protein EspA n=1 Tax=Rouxiella aceris TaxID=2703884 RepID=A0A848MH54_9GAMM|nr:secretion protein EspA [Rouxiella aceris]NMP26481.1 secretion protein EspA [Rouxiella aceris]